MSPLTPTIGLNAHLLSAQAGYRQAGIHGYIWHLMNALPQVEPLWRYRAYVGEGQPPAGFDVRRSKLKTGSPLRRIIWEQTAQPLQLDGLDLMHELAFVAPVIMPTPFVVTVYDLTFMRYPEHLSTLRRIYLRLLTGLSCKRARRVMAISQSTADDLVSLLGVPRDKIDLAIPGIDGRFCPLPTAEIEEWRNRKGLPERFLLFVGTLEPRKNLPMLLRAYAALPESDRRACHLVLAGGKGWMDEAIQRTIDVHRLADVVHLPGYVDDDELPLWYNAAEALVYPSVFEGWGMPVTEAMACGKPVIVSNVSSLPEAAGDVGLQLQADDTVAWTEGLARCIHDHVWREEQGQRALRRSKQFTWHNTALQAVTSYRKALGMTLNRALEK